MVVAGPDDDLGSILGFAVHRVHRVAQLGVHADDLRLLQAWGQCYKAMGLGY